MRVDEVEGESQAREGGRRKQGSKGSSVAEERSGQGPYSLISHDRKLLCKTAGRDDREEPAVATTTTAVMTKGRAAEGTACVGEEEGRKARRKKGRDLYGKSGEDANRRGPCQA